MQSEVYIMWAIIPLTYHWLDVGSEGVTGRPFSLLKYFNLFGLRSLTFQSRNRCYRNACAALAW